MDIVRTLTAAKVFRISIRCISLPADRAIQARHSLKMNLTLVIPSSESKAMIQGPLRTPVTR
eukprot:4612794-Pyramimonas_sp.AAC.2